MNKLLLIFLLSITTALAAPSADTENANVQVTGNLTSTLTANSSVNELNKIWHITLDTNPKQLIHWQASIQCKFILKGDGATQAQIIYWESEDKNDTTYTITEKNPLELTLLPVTSKSSFNISINVTPLKNSDELTYTCEHPIIQATTEPELVKDDIYKLTIDDGSNKPTEKSFSKIIHLFFERVFG